jgi:hypothetical protein
MPPKKREGKKGKKGGRAGKGVTFYAGAGKGGNIYGTLEQSRQAAHVAMDADAALAHIEGKSVKELKKIIVTAGLPHADCFEKPELRKRAVEALCMPVPEAKAEDAAQMATPSDALQACVKAIVEEDATALLKAVESTQLPVEVAMNVATQAWRKDVGRNKIGDKHCEGGLLSAVYIGVMLAQEAACVDTRGDNATTLLASLAVKEDDPRLVDVLLDWDPDFRMGPSDAKATVDTTAQFFLDLKAPTCAARLLERKTDLVLARGAAGGGVGAEGGGENEPSRKGEAPEGKDPDGPGPGGAAREGAGAATEKLMRCGLPSCEAEATKRCTVCKAVSYCSLEHQRAHWKTHKVRCRGNAKCGASGGGAAGGAGTVGGKDAGEGDGGEGGDPGERIATRGRCNELEAKMTAEGSEARTAQLLRKCPLGFALGGRGDPHDADAVKLVLGMDGVDVNETNSWGQTVLFVQCSWGRSRNVELLLADPRVDPNLAESERQTPLHVAAAHGRVRCVEVLLADERVDPNLPMSNGYTPLNFAACNGMDSCVELLLRDERVDVCRASANGQTPLISACTQLMHSMDRVGAPEGNDPARTLVIMLRSRRIPKHNLKESIVFLGQFMPTRRQIDSAEAGGEPLQPNQKMARLVIPVLMAQLKGEFRWCAHCLKLTPDVDLHRCGGCKQVGYCDEALPGQKPCHAAHWKAGHKKECKRFAAEAKAAAEAEEAAETEAAAGKGGGADGGGDEGGIGGGSGKGGGGGGGGKKQGRGKKGWGKKKKGR